MTSSSPPLSSAMAPSLAHEFVARFFTEQNRKDLAQLIRSGDADDFPEVRIAVALLREQSEVMSRFRAALAEYAAPDFWDDDLPGGSLARHDGGEMARNVLSGRPHFFHRD